MPSGKIADTNTRTNITISKDLKAKLEFIAVEQNRSFNNLVITVLKEFVAKKFSFLNKQNAHIIRIHFDVFNRGR